MPAKGSRGDATRIVPSGTPTFGNARAASVGFSGVAAMLVPVGVAATGNGVSLIRPEVGGVAAAAGVVSLRGASTVREN
jgi:hypothetical protein